MEETNTAMKKKINAIIAVAFMIVLLAGITGSVNSAGQMPGTPIVRKINLDGAYYNKPSISGLTNKNTDVLVYIDDVLSGLATVKIGKTPTDSFNFRVQTKLKTGKHKIILVAKNKNTKILSAPTKEYFITVKGIARPIVYKPNSKFITGNPRQEITGWSDYGSIVYVYIDEKYDGKTKLPAWTTNFTYKPAHNLTVGAHSVYVVAEDKNGEKSATSETNRFIIEKPFAAPTLFKMKYTKGVPLATGLVRNNSTVRVYIDKKKVAQFAVKKPSGTNVSFYYYVKQKLTAGQHRLSVDAIDARGKVSAYSALQPFTVKNTSLKKKPIEVKSVKTVVKATPVTDKKIIKNDVPVKEAEQVIKESEADNQEVKETQGEDDFTKELLGSIDKKEDSNVIPSSTTTETTGNASSIKTNTIIFLAFLVAVIAWIIWVNRELIKERNKTDEEEINEDESEAKK